jgi:hypothetical protein
LNAGYPPEPKETQDPAFLREFDFGEKNIRDLEKGNEEARREHEKEREKKFFNVQKLKESENKMSSSLMGML